MSPSDFFTIIQSLPKGQSGFPTKDNIAKATKLNPYNVKLMLGGLVNNGKLRMEGNWYKFNEETLLEKYDKKFGDDFVDKTIKDHFKITDSQAQDYIEAITEENKHDSIEGGIIANRGFENQYPSDNPELIIPLGKKLNIKMPSRFKEDNSFTILRWVMLIIGIGSGIMSCYYTQIWQYETLNIFWSWFLSLIMIGFSSAAFLTLIGLLTKSIHSRFSTWALSIVFFILWIICLIYSISVTVAGRFSQYQEIVLTNQVAENTHTVESIKTNNILESINSLKLERDNNQKRLNTLFLQAEDIQKGYEIKGETWVTIQSRILNVQNLISELNMKIANKNIEYEKMLESPYIISKNESKFGFYDWMAKIYKTDKGNIEWIMILFPSLFLDIASPIALAVFMFLGRGKDE
jgi:hypothetical protein